MRFDIYVIYLLLRLLALLPLRVLHGIGAGLGRLVLWRGGRTAHHTAVNLRIARPLPDAARQRALLREVMGEGGKSITEIVKVWGGGAGRALDADGSLWSRDTDACCGFRKVAPLAAALKPFAAQVTGRKRFQTRERGSMQPGEWFDGRFRFNPLWQWSQSDLQAYAQAHKLPAHPLVADCYPSIGCIPCTRRVTPGEDYRAGRWAGLDKDECGIHVGTDGDGI